MDSPLIIAAAASFIAGVAGYIIARFWIKPIGRYNLIKRRMAAELKRYEQLTLGIRDAEGRQVLRSARKNAMDLTSCYDGDIPYWYRLLLDSRRESPSKALEQLMGLSKSQEPEKAAMHLRSARTAVRLD